MAAIRARGRFGVNLGLARIEGLLGAVGHPERELRGALVAGTNGKGSVVALAASALLAGGYSVGTMPKPHLVHYRERITRNGEPLDEAAFAAVIGTVIDVADRLAPDHGPPTEFEVLTAAGLLAFARDPVDVALVEVGMGGRLDATNAADLGVAAVTTVQHDHERHLGRTLAAIGGEKAAIIKRGNLAVTGAQGRGLAPVIGRCGELGVPLRRAGRGQPWDSAVVDSTWDGLVITLRTPWGTLTDVMIGLLGSHQATNAAVAAALLDALREDGERRGRQLVVDEGALRAGLAAARWAGRLERLPSAAGGRDVVLDGAHNPAGARVLAASLAELGVRHFPLVFGAMRGKRVADVLRAFAPLEPRPVFTAVADPHAHRPEILLRTWRRVAPASRGAAAGTIARTPAAALARAAHLGHGAAPVVVAGSLYLVGAVRAIVRHEIPDP